MELRRVHYDPTAIAWSGESFVVDENNVQLLISMGFVDENEVKRALRIAKNDLNEAVSLLTNEVPGLHDVEMGESSGRSTTATCEGSSSNPNSVETMTGNGDDLMDIVLDSADGNAESENTSGNNASSLEFPTTHLYQLEERVFTSQWSIPYKRDESLGRCLSAATRLAKEGLMESDENCKRFVEHCLPECFQKLLTALQVNQWNVEIHEGIFNMLQLFMDLVAARLVYDPVPYKLLDILAMVFDPHNQFHQKNRRRAWSGDRWEKAFGDLQKIPAVPSSNVVYSSSSVSYYDSVPEPYGFLLDLINRLALKNGFALICKKLESGKSDAQEMLALLRPLANGAEFLNVSVFEPLLRPCCGIAVAYVRQLDSEEIKKPHVSNYVVDLLGQVHAIWTALLTDRADHVDELRLEFIHRLLKSSNFASKMQALKELSKLLEYLNSSNKREQRLAISTDRLSHWLSEEQILCLALEGNIDQAQYCDRLRTLLTFLGPRLSCQDIAKIWGLQKGRTAVTVDNVHNIIAQAAAKFSRNELDHLLNLIRTSWKSDSDRSKDKLLGLLGTIGRESVVSSTYESIAECLWQFAHQPNISEPLVNRALEEHLSVVSISGRDSCRSTFIQQCLHDIREGHFFLPAMGHLHAIVESVKKTSMTNSRLQKTIISDLVNNKRLVESLCDCIVRIHAQAASSWREKLKQDPRQRKPCATTLRQVVRPGSSEYTNLTVNTGPTVPPAKLDDQLTVQEELGPDFMLSDGYTLGQYVDGVLAFLRFILNEGELFLLIHRCRELWDALIADPDACRYEREAAFTWFTRGISDLDKKCQQTLFEDRMLMFDPKLLTETGFICFRKYFESVNVSSDRYRSYNACSTSKTMEIEKTDNILGLEYIWQTALNIPDQEIARQAVDMLISANYGSLTARLKRDPGALHKKFLNECYRRLEGAVLTFKASPVANLLQDAARLLAAPSFPALYEAPPPDRTLKIRNIERLLLIAEQYVKTVEDTQTPAVGSQPRTMPAHMACFFGPTFTIQIEHVGASSSDDGSTTKLTMLVHEHETLGTLRERVSELLGIECARLTLEHEGKELVPNLDQQVLKRLGLAADNTASTNWQSGKFEQPTVCITAKRRYLAAFVSTCDTSSKNSESKGSSLGVIFNSSNRQTQMIEQERTLPAVMMAQDRPAVFDMLYQLAQLDEPTVTARVRELLLLIPSDSGVIESLDTLMSTAGSATNSATSSKTNSLERTTLGVKASLASPSSTLSEKLGSMLTPGSASPKSQLKHKEKEKLASSNEALRQLFDLSFTVSGLTPFRVLYNLEILSSRLLPTFYGDAQTIQSAQMFAQAFVGCNGLHWLLTILCKDYLPVTVDAQLRQQICSITLQLLSYLLCNSSPLHDILRNQNDAGGCFASTLASATSVSTCQLQSALAATTVAVTAPVAAAGGRASEAVASSGARFNERLEPPHSCAVADFGNEELSTVLKSLQRLCWAAAGGMLHLIGSTDMKSPPVSLSGASTVSPHFFLGSPRSRTSESSTGSSDGDAPSTLHAGVLSTHTVATQDDVRIARETLKLMLDCVTVRPEDFCQCFFNLPYLSEFVLDILLVAESVELRSWTEHQLFRLVKAGGETLISVQSLEPQHIAGIGVTGSGEASSLRKIILKGAAQQQQQQQQTSSSTEQRVSPSALLLQILLKAHLPLWVPSSQARGSAQRLLSRCFEYFSLRGHLLSSLSPQETLTLQPTPTVMLEDECRWLSNFSCSTDPRLTPADNALLAGHMLLVTHLLRITSPSGKRRTGQALIETLINEFLFPAARLIASRGSSNERASFLRQAIAVDARAKCQKTECRTVAYDLLLELCNGCHQNYADVTRSLLFLHHRYEPELSNEWDHSPLVDAKMDAGFVGLKNAGATCYMNSVLQQFYNEPTLPNHILSLELDDDQSSLLIRELQRLMAHLRESEQQYYVPQKFWEVFRLWGQQVNPREQQDAFEFFTCLINQVDEYMKKNGREEIFRPKYQGIFSDQKICQGCPHKYEREESFYALNLPVRAHGLEESLNNFVKGEILEGDNAYFCEKCGQKRTALKRTCIKTLPEVMVIQLKRFGFDWEENRAMKFNDYFQFPLTLNLYPYTTAFLQAEVQRSSTQSTVAEDEDANWDALFATSPLTLSGQHFMSSSPVSTSPGTRYLRRQNTASSMGRMASEAAKYALVGVVVHSGQANAGHYYAYIKDRREDSPTYGSWFKFNDTTVDLVDMNEQFMEAELYGGKYTAKTEKNSSYPEERERYWNAYLLFYNRIGDCQTDARNTRTASKRSVSMCSQHMQPAVQVKSARRRDSLMELAELVEQGEQRNLFGRQSLGPQNMNSGTQQQWWQPPGWLKAEIQDDNFRFARNRDIFNESYFVFAERLVELAISDRSTPENEQLAVDFTLQLLLNTVWHCRRSLRGDPSRWANRIRQLTSRSENVCRRIVDFFNDADNRHYLAQFLFSCDNSDVRQGFGAILYHAMIGLRDNLSSSPSDRQKCELLLGNLLSLASKEAIERHQICGAYFYLIHQLAVIGGWPLCSLMLEQKAFAILLNFLLPMSSGSPFVTRRWTLNQARELGDVYIALAVLMLHCRLSHDAIDFYKPKHLPLGVDYRPTLDPPPDMEQLVNNAEYRLGFARELVWASCHVHNALPPLADLMQHCSWRNEAFSQRLIAQLLAAVSSQPSNDLKQVFMLMEDCLLNDGDQLQATRVEWCLGGVQFGAECMDGMLNIIKSSQASGDGRRTYNCIKFLVCCAERCRPLKESLNKRLDQWQWAVEWLRTAMETLGGAGSSEASSFNTSPKLSSQSSSLISESGGKSNEDSTTKNFQRTVSAQYTLDQAKALLSDIGGDVEPMFPRKSDDQDVPESTIDGDDQAKNAEEGTSTQIGNSMFYVKNRTKRW